VVNKVGGFRDQVFEIGFQIVGISLRFTEAGGAETHRIRQHGVEHRLKLAWRTGDDAQHLGRGGLLLQAAD
jgi:hypothetical protein